MLALKEIRRVLRIDGLKAQPAEKSRCPGDQIDRVTASSLHLLFDLIYQQLAESLFAQHRVDRNAVDDIASLTQRQHTARDQRILAVRMCVLNMGQIRLHCLADLPALDDVSVNFFVAIEFQTVLHEKLYQTLIFVRGTHHKFHCFSPFFLFRIAHFVS